MNINIKSGEYFTKKDIALRLGVSRQTIHTWVNQGKLKDTKIGRIAPIHENDLKAFLENNPTYQDKLPIDTK